MHEHTSYSDSPPLSHGRFSDELALVVHSVVPLPVPRDRGGHQMVGDAKGLNDCLGFGS